MSSVVRVSVENIMPLWSQVEPLLFQGLVGRPTHMPEDIRKLLLAHQCQLWIQWNDRVEAISITEFASYPRGIWVRVWIAACLRDAKMNDAAFYDAMEDWRLTNDCVGYEACGRPGWLRRIPTAKMEGLVMRVTFE